MAGKKILFDSPSADPALEFKHIAEGFKDIILDSRPNFAIGIFGGWGSGKTTLMNGIMTQLRPHADVIIVDFNAWRFEREPQLLIPLLDTIRLAILAHAEPDASAGSDKALRWQDAAGRIGRIVRALATGLSGSVGIPGAVTINYAAGPAINALRELSEDGAAPRPESLYVAAFIELQAACKELMDNGVGRIVVFVDDLDRCLPDGALAVLESMKLFFDLPGFIFVVGLDEKVIHLAVRSKFAPAGTGHARADGESANPAPVMHEEIGQDYAKKIFQVPYTLPVILPRQLDELLESMYKQAELECGQRDDIQDKVRPYLRLITGNERINPREVKRFINAYTLQTIVRLGLHPPVVLALQTIGFRRDWQDAYDAISADPDQFMSDLHRYREGDQDAFQGSLPGLEHLPVGLSDYLASELAAPLADAGSLVRYLSSLRSARGVDPGFSDALGALGRFERALNAAVGAPGDPKPADAVAKLWDELLGTTNNGAVSRNESLQGRLASISALLGTYLSDPTDGFPQLQQAQAETRGLQEALKLARDSAWDARTR